MKKTILLISLFFTTLLNSYAQSNIIKVNVLSLALVNFSLQDEYSLNGHMSVALGFSYMPQRGLPSVVLKEDPSNNAANLKFGGTSYTPEFRYYFKGEGPKGMYISAYYRYSKYNTDQYVFSYASSNGSNQDVTLNGDYTTSVVGLMLGSQYLLGKNFTLDWWIIGAGFGSQKGDYTGTGAFTDQDQQDIKDEVASINTPAVKISVTTSSTQVNLKVDPKFPAFRAFGLCLGYRF